MPRFRSELRRARLFRSGPAADPPSAAAETPGNAPEPGGLPDGTHGPGPGWLAPLLAVVGLVVPWAGAIAWGLTEARRRREQQIHQQQLQEALADAAQLRALGQKLAARLLAQQHDHHQPKE